MRSAECGVWNAECGAQVFRTPHSELRTREGGDDKGDAAASIFLVGARIVNKGNSRASVVEQKEQWW
jgi:hypothetical protein